MKIRINEAIARCRQRGHKVFKKDIAARLFPNVSEAAQKINIKNICTGRTKRLTPEAVCIICEMCDCTPNFLFGYEDED